VPAVNFKLLFDLSPNPYMLLDRQLRYVAANAAYERATGTSVEALVGRFIFDAFPNDPDDPANESARLLRDSLERVIATRAADVIALIPYRVPEIVDGAEVLTERFWSATHTPVLDEKGEVAFILQHTVDVTELHRPAAPEPDRGERSQLQAGVLDRARQVQEANTLLETERQHLRRLFEQSPGFIAFLRGPDHVFEIANQAYYQVVGHREIIGMPVRDALPELAGQGFLELLDEVYRSQRAFVGRGRRVLVQRSPGGELDELFLDFVYQPIVDEHGSIGVFVQGHDITGQLRLENELQLLLERERRARDELQSRAEYEQQVIGIVSHDLRNPLNVIAMAGSFLLQRGRLDDQQGKTVARIVAATERATLLIRDFLDFTQARSTGRMPVHPTDANIRDLARQVFDDLHLVYPDRHATIRHEGEENGWWDPNRLIQLFSNLVGNAFQHSPDQGTVSVLTQGFERDVRIEVHNDGDPIPAEHLPRLFEPFERGASTPSTERSIGLGLFISRQIVLAHGGTIEVRSTAEQGTTFVVCLPRRA
jgi:PAS domain S-box-containing protein